MGKVDLSRLLDTRYLEREAEPEAESELFTILT
jgi:hypothetical protein